MTNNPPYYMARMNIEQPINPDNINLSQNWFGYYFARYALQRIMGVWDVKLAKAGEGTNINWAYNYFWYCLFQFGYLEIFDPGGITGPIIQQCGVGGFNVMYQPYYTLTSNPALEQAKEYRRTIGKDCVLVQMTPDYAGIQDLINYYAGLLATISQTTTINLLNSKLSYVFAAKNRAAAQSLKKMYSQIMNGETAAFVDKKLYDEKGNPAWLLFNQNVGQNFIADKLLDAWQTVENKFATDIGLPNANTTKRERLISDEVNANNIATQALAGQWLENIQRGFAEANEMFGLNLSIDWKYKQEVSGYEGGDDNSKGDNRGAADAI